MTDVTAGELILAAHNNDLESRIDDLEAYDTYHNFSIQAPFSNRAGLASQYTKVKINGVECVWIYVVITGTPAMNGQLIATLPSGYQPASVQDYVCSGLGVSDTLTPVIEIDAAGTVKLYDCALFDSNWHLGWQLVKGPLS
jgi:hypothetical protein